jgi:alpha-tubulin suppressor-like RCC1 family protein
MATRPRAALFAVALPMLPIFGLPLLATDAHATADSRLPRLQETVMALGDSHSLFIDPSGSLFVWGDNAYGELGDGTNTQQLSRKNLSFTNNTQVAAGKQFSLLLQSDGSIWTWGRDDVGQLGNGQTTTSTTTYRTRAKMGTANDWRFVAAGSTHALAIKYDGSLWGWGDNSKGQLGITGNPIKSPTRIGSRNDWVQVAGGTSFTVALAADGTIWTTGDNTNNQLGRTGTTTTLGQVVTGDSTNLFTQISAGASHVLALEDDGSVYGWGLNDKYQLTSKVTTASQATPLSLSGGPYRKISAGAVDSVAIRWDGVLIGWGNNAAGELCIPNDTSQKKTPTTMSSASTLGQYVAAGNQVTMLLDANGTLQTCGLGTNGQLATGNKANKSTVQTVATVQKPGLVGAGTGTAYSIDANGMLSIWGDNQWGQFGTGYSSPNLSPEPEEVPIGGSWLYVTGAEKHTIGINANGKLYTWGTNVIGDLGTPSIPDGEMSGPIEILSGKKLLRATAHYEDSLALTADGRLWGWGDNSEGQCGCGTNDGRSPAQTGNPKLGRWVAMSLSNDRGAGIASDGTLYGWGEFRGGVDRAPVQISTDRDWVTVISGGGYGTLGVKANGGLYYYDQATKKMVRLASNLTFYTVGATDYGVVGVTPNSKVYALGLNDAGALGTGTQDAPNDTPTLTTWKSPVQLAGAVFSMISLSSYNGNRQTCGDNTYGELGNLSVGGVSYTPGNVEGDFF